MAAQIKHIAIVTDHYTLLARFYEAVFRLWTFPSRVEAAAMAVSDGHVGLNFNLRPPGRQAGLDHFGFEVEDEDQTIRRAAKYRGVGHLRRPSNRPFAGLSMNDPAGNVFDLAHKVPDKFDSVYKASPGHEPTPSRISHFLLRTVDPALLSEFYRDVFQLEERPKAEGDPNHYLSDGSVTMIIGPWRIEDYAGTGVARPAMDHLGFAVESLDTFEANLRLLEASNSALKGPSLTATAENNARLALLKTCSLGRVQLTDPDGNLLDIDDASSHPRSPDSQE